ncbi:hypothetical protein BDV33DRAFT_178734 [Aspergillus novoparasiticus]|uniref:Uncharacterized protein n=1 Tax=Aspergillus novoparasiticus TaxID=986946 RepID=A0A5N6EG47_9EURO|nr:hypothetical protein BDV33DRAFT_178734 [Aspergillus novoparasiticus]
MVRALVENGENVSGYFVRKIYYYALCSVTAICFVGSRLLSHALPRIELIRAAFSHWPQWMLPEGRCDKTLSNRPVLFLIPEIYG